jgi:HK97 family phage major capsid protein
MKTIEEIEKRLSEITAELDQPEADLDALQEEVRSLNEQRDELRKAAKEAAEKRAAIAAGLGKVTEKQEEKPTMNIEEIRKSPEYVDAFARYIRSNDDRECRALLKTENASGTVPVPVLVDEIIRTAWDNEAILSRVRKTNFKGNLKVAFERSATGAYEHIEGTSAPTEEDLALGIVTMTPVNIKKWVHITDEDVAMGGEAFLRYIYDELTYQIVKKLAGLIVTDIASLSTTNGATAPGAAKITVAPGLTTVAQAFANLSDEADNPVVIMNKLTYANFQAAYAAGNFAVDPMMGLTVLFNNTLPAYDAASANAVYAIVGDLRGAQVNYPEGEGVVIKWDDLSESEKDLVKVVGRQYAAHAVTAPFRFTNIAKPAGT